MYAGPDTGVYIEHEQKLRDLDFTSLLPPSRADQTLRVVVPMIVLDELDGLKRKGDAHGRWRAGYTLAVMEEAFANQRVPGMLREPDRTRGAVILEPPARPAGPRPLADQRRRDHRPRPRGAGARRIRRHPGYLRHQPGAARSHRRAASEEADRADRRGTPGHKGPEGEAASRRRARRKWQHCCRGRHNGLVEHAGAFLRRASWTRRGFEDDELSQGLLITSLITSRTVSSAWRSSSSRSSAPSQSAIFSSIARRSSPCFAALVDP